MSKNYKVPSTKELLDAGVHFGHQIRRWHPAMEKYIFTVKKNIHIIDLGQTEKCLEKTCEYLYNLTSNGGHVVFVGTKRQSREIVENEAKRVGAYYVTERWLGGTITNFEIVRKTIEKLVRQKKERDEGLYMKYTKKERLLIDRDIEKLQRIVGGLVGMTQVPAAIFVVDAKREKTAIREAHVAGAKVVAIVDTNTNPEKVDYVIPGNDDGIKSLAILVKTVADAIEAGYKEYGRKLEKGKVAEPEVKVAKVDVGDTQTTVTTAESRTASEDAGKDVVRHPEKLTVEDVIPLDEDIVVDASVAAQLKKIVDETQLDTVQDVKPAKIKKAKINTTKKEKK